MDNSVITIICAIIGSGAFFAFIQFLITRHDNKKSKNNEVTESLNDISNQIKTMDKKVDTITMREDQTHLAVLISDYPSKHAEIYRLGEIYFKNGGDDWITGLFDDWLKSEHEDEPDWFIQHKREHK